MAEQIRDMKDWMRAMERRVSAVSRGLAGTSRQTLEQVEENINKDKDRRPAAPVELAPQTYVGMDVVSKTIRAGVIVDFPDVVVGSDAQPIQIESYELWARNPSEVGGKFHRVSTSPESVLSHFGYIPGSVWEFKARALGTYTVRPGDFSAVITVQMLADTTPPPQPSTPVATASGKTIKLEWDGQSVSGSMPLDLLHVEVAAGPASAPTTVIDRFPPGGPTLNVYTDIPYNTPWFFRLRAVDNSGLKSPWSVQVSATTKPLVDADVILSVIDAATTQIKNIGAESIKSGAILAEKLADNSISQAKLQDGIISASKLATSVEDDINKSLADASTAITSANNANTAAGTAQTAANNANTAAANAAKAARDAKIATIASDRDPNAVNKWLFTRVDILGDMPFLTAPTLEYFASTIPSVQSHVPDGVSLVNWVGDKYYGNLRTSVRMAAAGTLNFTATHDDGGAIFVDGVEVYRNNSYAANSNISIPIGVGWHVLDFVWVENSGGDGWMNFNPTIRSLVAEMVGPSSASGAMASAIAANAAAIAAQAKADSAFDDAQEALTNAGLAQSTANSKNAAYYTASAPAGTGFKVNDQWFRSPDNKLHLWDGDSWEPRADQAIATAKAAADAADAAAKTADAKAVTAQTAADQAKTAGAEAKAAANTAQSTADGKGIIHTGTTAPSPARSQDLWIDTTNGANTPKTWNGTAWVSRTDKVAADATTAAATASSAAATADQKAATAQTKANEAATAASNAQTSANNAATAASTADSKAATAQTAANNAQTAANNAKTAADNAASAAAAADSKAVAAQTKANEAAAAATTAQQTGESAATLAEEMVKISTTTPPTGASAPAPGAIWQQVDPNNTDRVIQQWVAGGDKVYKIRYLQDEAFGNISAVKITAGTMSAARMDAADMRTRMLSAGKIAAGDIVTGTLTSASGVFGTIDASIINAGTLNASRLNAGDVRAKFIEAGKIAATDIVTGTLTSASGVFGTIDANIINAGTLNAARLNAGDVRAKFIAAGKIVASELVAGTLTSASGVFGTMDASVINAGTLNAARIAAGSIAANKLVIGSAVNAMPDPGFHVAEINASRQSRSTGTWDWNAGTATSPNTMKHTTTGTGDHFHFAPENPDGVGKAGNAALQVKTGQKIVMSVTTWTSESAAVRWAAYRHYADGTASTFSSLHFPENGNGTRKVEYVYTVPDGVVAMDFALVCNTSGVSWSVHGDAVVAIQSGATMIEDGAISTNKIEADAIVSTHITAGAIVAGKIAADAITAKEIKAGEITANEIKAASLTSASGIFGTIDANIINAGTLNAARLNAGDVRAKFIAAGKVTAVDMETGTITAASGIIGSLDIGKVTTGTLNGSFITARSLRANALMVSDLTNFAPPLTAAYNASSDNDQDWDFTGQMESVTSGLDDSGFRLHVTNGTGDSRAYGPLMSVKPGEKLYGAATVYRGSGTAQVYLRYEFLNSSKVGLSGGSGSNYIGSPASSTIGNGGRMEVTATVPAGAAYARWYVIILSGTATTGFYNFEGRRQAPSTLIEDGAITTDKVKANAITARVMTVGDFANRMIGSDFEVAADIPWSLHAAHYRSNGTARSGSYALHLNGANATSSAVIKSTFTGDTKVQPGEEWLFRLYGYKTAPFNGTNNTKLRVASVQSGAHLASLSFDQFGTSWPNVPYEMSVIIPSGTTSLLIEIWSDHTAGNVWLDDIQMRRMSEASLIQNLGVEKLTASTASMGTAVIDKLWTDVVRSRKITADMLVVGRGVNGIVDEFFEDEAVKAHRHKTANGQWGTWGRNTTTNLNWYGNPTLDGVTSRSFYFVTNGPGTYQKDSFIPVEEGQKWRLNVKYTSDVSGPRGMVLTIRKDGTMTATSGGWNNTSYAGAGQGLFLERIYTVPSDVAYIMPAVQFNTTCTSAYVYGGATFTNMMTASLVVDGAIAAKHLTVTDELTTKVLGAYKIKAINIDTNDLQADTGFVADMEANILTADAITSTILKADAITSKHTITGAKIQTVTTANRGIKLEDSLFRVWDANGGETFSLNGSTGAVVATGKFRTGTSGNFAELLGDSNGGKINFWTGGEGTGKGRGSIWARNDPSDGEKMSLAYSTLDAPDGNTLPVLVVTPTKAYMRYGSKAVQVWNNGGSEELLIDGSAVMRGNLDMRNGGTRIQFRHGDTASSLAWIGNRPESGTSADFEIRPDAGGVRITGALQNFQTYNLTTTGSANINVDGSGNFKRSSSASRYKLDQREMVVPESALDVKMKDWIDRGEMERLMELEQEPRPMIETKQREYDSLTLRRIPGMVAEDLEDAGVPEFVVYGPEGQTEGIMYDRFALAYATALKKKLDEALTRLAALEGN